MLRRALVALVVFSCAVVGVTLRLFIWPPTHTPSETDAVVVLSGQSLIRLQEGTRLVTAGVADTLVFVGEPDHFRAQELCRTGSPEFDVVCLRPQPDNTRNEARAVADLATARGWRDLAVVTSTQHVTRAGVLFRRCHDGRVSVVGTDLAPGSGGLTLRALVHEWAGLGYALTAGWSC